MTTENKKQIKKYYKEIENFLFCSCLVISKLDDKQALNTKNQFLDDFINDFSIYSETTNITEILENKDLSKLFLFSLIEEILVFMNGNLHFDTLQNQYISIITNDEMHQKAKELNVNTWFLNIKTDILNLESLKPTLDYFYKKKVEVI